MNLHSSMITMNNLKIKIFHGLIKMKIITILNGQINNHLTYKIKILNKICNLINKSNKIGIINNNKISKLK